MTTSISFHLRPSQAAEPRPGRLFIRIIRARQCRHVKSPYLVSPEEWDPHKKQIVIPGLSSAKCAPVVTDAARAETLARMAESMRSDLRRLGEIVSQLEDSGADFTAADIAARFNDPRGGDTLRGYASLAAGRLREQGRERTARAYRSAVRSLTRFNGGGDVPLSEIDAPLIRRYERHLLDRGLNLNTVSFYLRNLRAIYFRAAASGIIAAHPVNPFAGTHTGVYGTRRRALDGRQLKALARLEAGLLPAQAPENRTDNRSALHDSLMYFLFCYHARGMSFVDMAHLKKEDVGEHTLTYRRRKTGGALEVTVTEPMRRILSHFTAVTEGSDYVFPVIDSRLVQIRRQYETGLKRQNRMLKELARRAGIPENLSTHAARHTWATLAKRLHVPVAVIGEALGHRDVKTTSIYLASFDRSTMDELSARLSEAARAA